MATVLDQLANLDYSCKMAWSESCLPQALMLRNCQDSLFSTGIRDIANTKRGAGSVCCNGYTKVRL